MVVGLITCYLHKFLSWVLPLCTDWSEVDRDLAFIGIDSAVEVNTDDPVRTFA